MARTYLQLTLPADRVTFIDSDAELDRRVTHPARRPLSLSLDYAGCVPASPADRVHHHGLLLKPATLFALSSREPLSCQCEVPSLCHMYRAASVLQSAAVVGLDAEWKPRFLGGENCGLVQILQASLRHCTSRLCRLFVRHVLLLPWCNRKMLAAMAYLRMWETLLRWCSYYLVLGLTGRDTRGGLHLRPPGRCASAGLRQLRGRLPGS